MSSNNNNKSRNNINLQTNIKKQKKSKSKKGNPNKHYWIVKIPKWVGEEWWNDKKYPNGATLGWIDVSKDPNQKETGFHIIPTNYMSHTNEYRKIPTEFKLKLRDPKYRINTKFGETKQNKKNKDSLLIFNDKPPFDIGYRVEALYGKPNTISTNDSLLNKYKTGTIRKVLNNRTYHVDFDDKTYRMNVEERDIRLLKYDPKADKCIKKGKSHAEFDLLPITNVEYFSFLKQKSKEAVGAKEALYVARGKMKETMASRGQAAIRSNDVKINRRILDINDSNNSSKTKKAKKEKTVRQSKMFYRQKIFDAYNSAKTDTLTQKTLEQITGQKWRYLKDVIILYADHRREASNKVWELKSEYKLNLSNKRDDSNDNLNDGMGPPPKKKQRTN